MADDIGDSIEGDLVDNLIPDQRFTRTVMEIYKEYIGKRNATAIGAAKEAGISTQLHNIWLKTYPEFCDFIYEQEQIYLTTIREKVSDAFTDLIEEDNPDPKTIMDMGMKYLKNIDGDFGTSKQEITVNKKDDKLPDVGTSEKIQDVIQAAEAAANTPIKDEDGA